MLPKGQQAESAPGQKSDMMSADPRIQVVRAVTRIQAEFIHRIFTKPNQRAVSQVFPPFHRHHNLSTSKVTMHHLFQKIADTAFFVASRTFKVSQIWSDLSQFSQSLEIFFKDTCQNTWTFQKFGINTYFTKALAAIQNSSASVADLILRKRSKCFQERNAS